MSPFSLIVPGLPHPLLAPEGNPGWGAIRAAYDQARARIEASDADLLLLYSTQWFSILGHQIQADPAPEWVHVDQEFHELGTMPYTLRMDPDFAEAYNVAETHPEIADRLDRQLEAWRTEFRANPRGWLPPQMEPE